MKRILSILLLLLLLCGCGRQADKDAKTESRWVLTQMTTEFFYDWVPETEVTQRIYSYDAYGNRTSMLYYQQGEVTDKDIWRYDEAGNQIEAKSYDGNGIFAKCYSHSKTTYDDQGRALEIIYYDGWFESSRIVYTYDDENHTMTMTSSDGGAPSTYTYDEAGKVLRYSLLYEDVEFVLEYTYDENGNQILGQEFWDGQLRSWEETEYDSQNRKIRFTSYDQTGAISGVSSYVYDDEANSRTWYQYDGDIRIEYYNDRGDCLRIEDYDEDGNLTMRSSYTYREIQVYVQ